MTQFPKTLLDHDLWPKIREFLSIEEYSRDGGHENPRIRIEFKGMPEYLSRECLALQLPCVSCKRLVHPLRQRMHSQASSLYYACACPLSTSVACSRTKAAAKEYRRFRSIDKPDPRQGSLF